MRIGVLLAIVFVASGALVDQDEQHSTGGCSLIQQALAESQRIKPGMKRKDVEKYFRYDGGLQFPDQARFTYPNCNYIRIDVEFAAAPERGASLTSSNDTVTKISRLYLDYPTKD